MLLRLSVLLVAFFSRDIAARWSLFHCCGTSHIAQVIVNLRTSASSSTDDNKMSDDDEDDDKTEPLTGYGCRRSFDLSHFLGLSFAFACRDACPLYRSFLACFFHLVTGLLRNTFFVWVLVRCKWIV